MMKKKLIECSKARFLEYEHQLLLSFFVGDGCALQFICKGQCNNRKFESKLDNFTNILVDSDGSQLYVHDCFRLSNNYFLNHLYI